MSDVKFGAGSGGGRGPRGERGERGERGHRGHTGPTGPGGEFSGPPFWPPFPPPPVPVVTTIFARVTGSDATGDGSIANPFRTFQRAIRNVPPLIDPGTAFTVDITGIGVETLPDNYVLPDIIGPAWINLFDDPSTFPFRGNASLNIRATPQPASGLSPAAQTIPPIDIVSITADPATGLVTITTVTPQPEWAGNALKGKMLIGDGSSGAGTSTVIFASDPTHVSVANTIGNMPVQTFSIVEPSATLQTTTGGVNGTGLGTFAPNSIAFQGIHFLSLDGAPGVAIGAAPQPIIELCVLEGISSVASAEQVILFSSLLTGIVDFEAGNITPDKCLFLSTTFAIFGEVRGFLVRRTVFDTIQTPIGPQQVFNTSGGTGGNPWSFLNCLITNAQSDPAIFANSLSQWSLETVAINGGVGDAILCEDAEVLLTAVTGTGNAGFGVHTIDQGIVRVLDAATDVTGTAGDMKVGALAARTWVNFRTVAPTFNQYDNTSPAVGGVGGGTSGSRVFQRAIGVFPP